MAKIFKSLLIIVIAVAAAYFVFQQFFQEDFSERDLAIIKEQIISDPVVQNNQLTEAQRQNFLSRFEEAKQNVIEFNFDTLQGVNNIGFMKQSLGDFEGAITAYEYGNLIRPNNSLIFSNLAALYHFDLQDYELAEKNYLVSIVNDPDDMPTIRNLYELYFYALEDNKKTESLLIKSIEDNPGAADLYSLAGSFYRDIGETKKAIEAYEKHLQLSPSSSAVRDAVEKLKQEIQ